MLLTKSSQQHNKHPFRNTEIKKSIQLHKGELQKIRQSHHSNNKLSHKSNKDKFKNVLLLNSEQKECREMYYGNTTMEKTRSGNKTKSQEGKLSARKQKKEKNKRTNKQSFSVKSITITAGGIIRNNSSKKQHPHHSNHLIKSKHSNNIQSPSVTDYHHHHINPRSPIIKKHSKNTNNNDNTSQTKNKKNSIVISKQKKEQHRLKKIEAQYMKVLEEKLQQMESEYNTIRTRNMLEEARGMGGWVDGLNGEEVKRLRRIHKVEEEILNGEIGELRREILGLCESEKNRVFEYYGGHYYDCEDVMSWIEGKD